MKTTMTTLTVLIAASALIVGFSCPAAAAVSGQCSNCHTMHDSQGAAAMATGGPHASLLLADCLGCHTTSGSDPLDDSNSYPYVSSTGDSFTDDNCLAGGFFPSTMGTGDNADDHHGVSASQTNDPAGYDGSFYTGGANGLGCAGSNGCHGNETDVSDMEAISGEHHTSSGAYRMLYVDGDPVESSGAVDYEELIIKTPATSPVTSGGGQNVNIYCAGTATASYVTISALCAKCHGDFHGTANTQSGSDWIRHPTENAISTSWAIGALAYSPDGADYKNNPVGYDNATIDLDEKRVVCMSCHRAHGTENADLLRWDYSTQSAGSALEYGCLGCHDTQR